MQVDNNLDTVHVQFFRTWNKQFIEIHPATRVAGEEKNGAFMYLVIKATKKQKLHWPASWMFDYG
jgi:hypothetical protein